MKQEIIDALTIEERAHYGYSTSNDVDTLIQERNDLLQQIKELEQNTMTDDQIHFGKTVMQDEFKLDIELLFDKTYEIWQLVEDSKQLLPSHFIDQFALLFHNCTSTAKEIMNTDYTTD